MIEEFYKRAFPVLALNDSYYLREQVLEDTEGFFDYYTRPEVSEFILATTPQTLFEAESEIYYCRNLFRLQRGVYWTIARHEDEKIVGAIGLYINNFHHRAELSYDLNPTYWRQGIMSMAINTVCEFSLKEMDIHRIEAITMIENYASQALLKKCGFLHEGQLAHYKYFQGKPYNVEMFSRVT